MESHFRAFSSSLVGATSRAPLTNKSFFRDCAIRSSSVISDMDLTSVLGSSLPSGSMMVLPNEKPLFKNGKLLPSPFTPGGNGGLSIMPDNRLVDRRDGSGGISILVSRGLEISSPVFVDVPCFQEVDPRSFLLKLEDNLAFPSTMVNSWQVDDDELERRVKSSSPRLKGGWRSLLELLDIRDTDSLSLGPNKVWVLRNKMSAEAKSLHRCCMTTSEIMIRWPSLLPAAMGSESKVYSTGGSPSSIPSVRPTDVCLFVLMVPSMLSL
jgi:hypothetical protein